MKKTLCSIAFLAALSVSVTADIEDFDHASTGGPDRLPAGWVAGQTGTGAAKWTIERDDTAPSKPFVLKQGGTARYPICIKTDAKLKNGFVAVKFKALSGKEDQAGGLVWRYQDTDNYYVARANALENNVTIYHTVKGKRTEFKRVKIEVSANQWHDLRVEFADGHFTVIFDQQKVIDWDDTTFQDAGAVGVWTKADSVTLFDDFTYGPAPAR